MGIGREVANDLRNVINELLVVVASHDGTELREEELGLADEWDRGGRKERCACLVPSSGGAARTKQCTATVIPRHIGLSLRFACATRTHIDDRHAQKKCHRTRA